MRAIAVLESHGHCTLVAPGTEPVHHAADEVRCFDAQWLCTLRQDQLQAAAAMVDRSDHRTAIEFTTAGELIRQSLSKPPVDIDPTLWKLRRHKDADEREMLRHAIACTDAMYQKAREIISPGITELEIFQQLHGAAVAAAGEPLTALGNDFQCNSPGGPPRQRPLRAGELIILDLGPAYRGYHADNCRTFAVDGRPTDAQLAAKEAVLSVLDLVRDSVKPGDSCHGLFVEAKAMLDEFLPDSFFHHLGHGIGLYPHEAPHLNPNWNDRFEEGDVIAVEPGLYSDSLRAGIRIEENFQVTADGVRQLTTTSTEL